MMPLIISDDWERLFDVFNTAVEISAPIEKYQFNVLPNASAVARVLDKFDSAHSPWASTDQNKDKIIITLQDLLVQLQNSTPVQEEVSNDSLLIQKDPEVDPHIPHYSSSGESESNNVLSDELLQFSNEIVKDSNKKSEKIIPLYEAPPSPIVIAPPSDNIPSSPMVLRSKNSILSPRAHKPKKKFIK